MHCKLFSKDAIKAKNRFASNDSWQKWPGAGPFCFPFAPITDAAKIR